MDVGSGAGDGFSDARQSVEMSRVATTAVAATEAHERHVARVVKGDGRAVSEASGRITPASAPAIAASGVDLISAGWLTHSASVLDIGLDWRH